MAGAGRKLRSPSSIRLKVLKCCLNGHWTEDRLRALMSRLHHTINTKTN